MRWGNTYLAYMNYTNPMDQVWVLGEQCGGGHSITYRAKTNHWRVHLTWSSSTQPPTHGLPPYVRMKWQSRNSVQYPGQKSKATWTTALDETNQPRPLPPPPPPLAIARWPSDVSAASDGPGRSFLPFPEQKRVRSRVAEAAFFTVPGKEIG